MIIIDPNGMDSTSTNQSTLGFANINPLSLAEQLTRKFVNTMIDGTLEGVDKAAEQVSDASTVGVIGLGVAGFVFPGCWTGIPIVAGAGTASDISGSLAKLGKAYRGTGSWDDFTFKSIETTVNLAGGKVFDNMGGKLVKETIKKGTGGTVFKVYRSAASGQFISETTAKGIKIQFNLTVAMPVSLSVSSGIDKLKDQIKK